MGALTLSPSRGARFDRKDVAFGLIVTAFAAAWVYLAIRVVDVSFTSDEALSYGIIHGIPTFVQSANNQWLNTWLMSVSQAVFGQSDWSFRMPNLIAFGLYGASSLVLIHSLQRTEARVIAFVLLLTDPLLLEFFGLARGYGLCIAFSAAALVTYFSIRPGISVKAGAIRLALGGCMAALAVYANFAALNLVVVLLAVMAVDGGRVWLADGARRARDAALLALPLVVSAASLIPAIVHTEHLRSIGQLYYGGDHGLVPDTVGSLAHTWVYQYPYPTSASGIWLIVRACVVVVFAFGIVWSAVRGVRTREWGPLQRAAVVLTLTLLAVQVEAWLLHTLYPIDRVALTYLVAFAFFCAYLADDVAGAVGHGLRRTAVRIVTAVALVAAVINVVRTANLTRTVSWGFDASARAVMNAVVRLEQADGAPAHPWLVLTGFPQNNALDYYRQRLNAPWLQPITEAPVSTPGGDLYVVTRAELGSLPRGTRLLAEFPQTDSELRAGPALKTDP